MPVEPLPTPDRHTGAEPRPVGEALDRVLRGLGAPAAPNMSALFRSWPELVGEQLAQRTHPISVRDGALRIAVDDPAWASQLRWLEPELLARMCDVLGTGVVERLEVRVRPRGSDHSPA